MRYSDTQRESTSLHKLRLDKVVATLLGSGAETVLDLGCGPGELLVRLASEPQFKRIVGMDTSLETLGAARQRLGLVSDGSSASRICLWQASFTSCVAEFAGFDAAVLLETIEHVEPSRLSAVEHAVFTEYHPRLVLLTTPNFEYNQLHGLRPGALRHRDHRFEWTRAKFQSWSEGVARRNGYQVVFDAIGPVDARRGSSTQMATFTRE